MRGIVCSLTDEKPTFDETCENYEADDTQVRRQSEMEDNRDFMEEDDRYSLPGSDWFKTLAIFSVINILLSLTGVVFIISLGSTQVLQSLAEADLMNPTIAFGIMILLSVFMFYTWYLTAKMGSVYAYTAGIIVYAVDVLMCAWLMYITEDLSILVSLAFNGFVLVLLITKRFSMGFGRIKETLAWGAHKIHYTILAVAAVFSLAYSMYVVKTLVPSEDDSVVEMVAKIDKTLPQDCGDGTTWIDVYVDGNSVYWIYKASTLEGYQKPTDEELRDYVSWMKYECESAGDTSFAKIANEGYDLVFKYVAGHDSEEVFIPNYMLREAL
jgi:hypothetical protein